MTSTAWSMVWQALVIVTCIAYFGLALTISRRAFAELWQMFRDLEVSDEAPPPPPS